MTVDPAQILEKQEVVARDWFEQALVTEVRIKVFFGMTPAKQQRMIAAALVLNSDDVNNDGGGGRGGAIDAGDGLANELESMADEVAVSTVDE